MSPIRRAGLAGAARCAALVALALLAMAPALPAMAEDPPAPAPVEMPGGMDLNGRIAGEFIVMTTPGTAPESLEAAWALLDARVTSPQKGGTLMLVRIAPGYDMAKVMAMMRATAGVAAVEPNGMMQPMPAPGTEGLAPAPGAPALAIPDGMQTLPVETVDPAPAAPVEAAPAAAPLAGEAASALQQKAGEITIGDPATGGTD